MLASGASAQSQQFCVKWNSYSTNLQSVFPRLLTSEHFVDLTLACEGRMIKCHKVVLSACSTYFERLLVQNPCQHPIIFMKDMKHWEVQALVDFMYKGEVNVSQDELNSLLVAAEALQIRGLCGSQQQQHHQSQQQSNLAQSSASTVQLPHDTVLSGGGGRESPPSYKRRRNQDDEAHTTPKISMSPSLNSRHSLPSDINSHHINQQHASSSERYSDHQEQHSDKKIKQEVEVEDNYLEGEVDVEEDFTNLEHPEDSDSNNREDAPLDQPGPSGLTSSNPPSMDKAVTDLNAAEALQNVLCVLSPSGEGETTITKAVTITGTPVTAPPATRIRRSEQELQKAAECVQKGMTFQNVSDIFKIPISTIRFYMARRGILPQRRRGRAALNQSAGVPSPHYLTMQFKLPDMGNPPKLPSP